MTRVDQPSDPAARSAVSLPAVAGDGRLWLPPLSLRASVRCLFSRDLGPLQLGFQQLDSYYPATPYCSISWWFKGSGEFVVPENPASQGPVVFAGPFTQPSVVRCTEGSHGMMLLLMPDAVQRMTGLQAGAFVNRSVAAEGVLPNHWMAMCHSVMSLPDDESRVRLIHDFFSANGSATDDATHPLGQPLSHWVSALGLRAAMSGKGRSIRQMERRIKEWAGVPLRELHTLARAEKAFFQILEAEPLDDFNWAAVAHDAGYSDQSHLCRVSKRVTGFSPEVLRRRMQEDEGFWLYRLWD